MVIECLGAGVETGELGWKRVGKLGETLVGLCSRGFAYEKEDDCYEDDDFEDEDRG